MAPRLLPALLLAALQLGAAGGTAPSPSTCASVPRSQRISCNAYNISYSTNASSCRDRGCCWDATAQPQLSQLPCFYGAPAVPITKVLIIDADHFDAGYHGLVKDVVNMYFDTFWPLALKISKDLRDGNHTETYTYTTFSWLASAYLHCPPNAGLHCPSATQLAEFKLAATRGDITWPAFPFNSEFGAYDSSMVAFGVNMTHTLDDLLGVPRKKVVAERDVPGVTRSVIPVLAKAGVQAINIAPNAQPAPANVPPAFIWKDGPRQKHGNGSQLFGVSSPSGQEMLTLFWDGWNYGIPGQPELGCDMVCFQTFPGCDTAVYFNWIGEDSGPNVDSAAAVLALYAKARAKFPGAEVVSGGLDVIVEALLQPKARASLPVLTGEIGDTWSYGISSDPKKTRDLRLLMRHRANYTTRANDYASADLSNDLSTVGGPSPPAPVVPAPTMPLPWWQNFSRFLLKGYEHTWGGGGAGTYKGNTGPSKTPSNFINSNFHADRANASCSWVKSLEQTWTDQRTWAVDMAIDAIGDTALRGAVQAERASVAQLEQAPPSTTGLKQVAVGSPVAVGKFTLFVDRNGAISEMKDTMGREWAGRPGAALLWLRYSLGTNAQMKTYRQTYCAGNIRKGDVHCDENTYGKPGLPRNDSVLANATVKAVFSGTDVLLVEVGWANALHVEAGAPASAWLKVSADGSDKASLGVELLLVNKTSTRQMEAMFLTFAPDTPNSMQQSRGTSGGSAGSTGSAGGNSAGAGQCEWSMDKLGEWVAAKDIMKGGSGGVSSIGSGVMCTRSNDQHMFIRSLDVGVVHWGSSGGASGNDMLPVGGRPFIFFFAASLLLHSSSF